MASKTLSISHYLDFPVVRTSWTYYSVETLHWLSAGFLQPFRMSVIHRLAGRLFQRARPCLGDTGSGEGRHDQPQEELEACCWSEFSFWSWTGAWVRGGAVLRAMSPQLSQPQAMPKLICLTDNQVVIFLFFFIILDTKLIS